MVNTIKQQQQNVNDSCSDCGSFVDIGAVIDEHDTELVLVFKWEAAEIEAHKLASTAQTRFDKVDVKFVHVGDDVKLILYFSVTVEKMLFQLENGV